jgi:hypothetical protein
LNWQINFVIVNAVGLNSSLLWRHVTLCNVPYFVIGTIITKYIYIYIYVPTYLILHKNIYVSCKFKWRKSFNKVSISGYISERTKALGDWQLWLVLYNNHKWDYRKLITENRYCGTYMDEVNVQRRYEHGKIRDVPVCLSLPVDIMDTK